MNQGPGLMISAQPSQMNQRGVVPPQGGAGGGGLMIGGAPMGR